MSIIYGVSYRYDGSRASAYNFYAEITWISSDIEKNTSRITISLYIQRFSSTDEINESGVISNIKLDGQTKYSTSSAKINLVDYTTYRIYSKEFEIAHDENGEKTLLIGASFSGVNRLGLERGSLSGNVELPSIPRASTFDSLTSISGLLNDSIVYKFTPKKDSFYTKLDISVSYGDIDLPIRSEVLGSFSAQQTGTVTLTDDELENIYTALWNEPECRLRFSLTTYLDAEYLQQVGQAQTQDLVLNFPPEINPTVAAIFKPYHDLPSEFSNIYVQGRSAVTGDITGHGQYGATIESKSLKVNGVSYGQEDNYTSEILGQYGEVNVAASATDSRGLTGTVDSQITVIAYANPKVIPVLGESKIVAVRCDASGNISESGTCLLIRAKRSYAKVEAGGVQRNFCKLQYRVKETSTSGEPDWVEILSSDAQSDEVITGALSIGLIDASKNFIAEIRAIDDVGEFSVAAVQVPQEKIYMHRDPARRALAIGKYIEENNCIDVAEDMRAIFRGGIYVPDGNGGFVALSEPPLTDE